MENDLAALRRQMRLDKIEYGLGCADTMDSDDLVAGLSATLQYVLEHALLRIERLEEPGAGV